MPMNRSVSDQHRCPGCSVYTSSAPGQLCRYCVGIRRGDRIMRVVVIVTVVVVSFLLFLMSHLNQFL